MSASIKNGIWATKAMVMNWGVHTYVLYDPIPMSGAALVGDNRTGKSTLIDALLTVLTGSTSGKNYNRAASGNGKQGKRKFLNYMVGKKEGTDGPGLRGGGAFTTHLAIEFLDRLTSRRFVFGISCDYNGPEDLDFNPPITWYSYDGALDQNLYIYRDPAGQTTSLPTSDLRKSLTLLSDGHISKQVNPIARVKIYHSARDYRNSMASRFGLSDTNYLNTLRALSSVSQNMRFSDFIFNNLCGTASKIDVTAMNDVLDNWKDISDSYDAQKQRQEAISKEISAYNDWATASRKARILNRAINLYLIAENERMITEKEKERRALECELHRTQEAKAHIGESITSIGTELEGIREALYSNDTARDKHDLIQKRDKSQRDYDNRQSTVTYAWDEIRMAYDKLQNLVPLCQDDEIPGLKAYFGLATELDELGQGAFSSDPRVLTRLIEAANSIVEEIDARSNELQGESSVARKRLAKAEEKLDSLRRNASRPPSGTAELVEYLKAQGLHAVSLAEALDIEPGEDAWRGPIEAILGRRREDVLVPVREFDRAWAAFKSYRGRRHGDLVDSPQIYARMKGKSTLEDTLARKVVAVDGEVFAVAQAYATFLLGEIHVASSIAQARKDSPERSSITIEGEYYHAYRHTTLSADRLNDFQIGKQASRLRVEREKREAREAIEAERSAIRRYQNAIDKLSNLKKSIPHDGTRFASDIDRALDAQQDADHLSSEISGLNNALELIDTSTSDELVSQAQELQTRLQRCHAEESECDTQIGRKTEKLNQVDTVLEELRASLESAQSKAVPLKAPDEEDEAFQASDRPLDSLNRDCTQATHENDRCWRRVELERDHCKNHMPDNDADISSTDNTPWLNEYEILSGKLLPTFRSEVAEVEREARRSFVNDVAGRLGSVIQDAQKATRDANRLLRNIEFGDRSYRFSCRKTTDPFVAPYYNMVTSPNFQQCSGGLWSDQLLDEFKDEANGLFQAMRDSRYGASESIKKDASSDCKKLLDVSNYLEFEMTQVDRDGTETRLTEGLEASSGGEAMLPLYLVLLAGLARIYRTNGIGPDGNTLRLVLIDEAFDKIDNRSVEQVLAHIHRLGLQPILAAPGETLAEELMMGTGAAFLHMKTEAGAYTVCHSNETFIGDNLEDERKDRP